VVAGEGLDSCGERLSPGTVVVRRGARRHAPCGGGDAEAPASGVRLLGQPWLEAAWERKGGVCEVGSAWTRSCAACSG